MGKVLVEHKVGTASSNNEAQVLVLNCGIGQKMSGTGIDRS